MLIKIFCGGFPLRSLDSIFQLLPKRFAVRRQLTSNCRSILYFFDCHKSNLSPWGKFIDRPDGEPMKVYARQNRAGNPHERQENIGRALRPAVRL